MLGDQLPVIRDEEPAEMLPRRQRLPCFCILAVAQDVKRIGRAEGKPVEPLALLAFALFGVLSRFFSRGLRRAGPDEASREEHRDQEPELHSAHLSSWRQVS